MTDKVAEILRQHSAFGETGLAVGLDAEYSQPPLAEGDFDEGAYLWRYPDVQEGLATGLIASAYSHYLRYGRLEGRRPAKRGERFGQRFHRFESEGLIRREPICYLANACDRLLISSSGGFLLIGWVDDAIASIHHIELIAEPWTATFDGAALVRSRRSDVEKEIGAASPYHYGYTGLLFLDEAVPRCDKVRIVVTLHNGAVLETQATPSFLSDIDLRDTVLSHFSAMLFYGNPQVELVGSLGAGCGAEVIKLNLAVTKALTSRPLILRMGGATRRPKASLIICLYGKAEFVFLQNALFSPCEGIEDYEFVFVCNSPEIAETIVRDAEICASVYGLQQTLVLLAGNAGFGGANNAAVQAARSGRIVALNPDVFPYDLGWARKHSELIETGAPQQTKLFGAPLYYDDGALMHGGMFFDVDAAVSLQRGQFVQRDIVRVEHYGKGAPDWAVNFTKPRPVPAVTGAFLSADRAWFESLGGFTEDFVFGHYEDADLCLKSLANGAPAWLHDLKLWHLEGKGSVRRPVHEGGSLVNRWLFQQRWAETLADGLLGPNPSHPALRARVGANGSGG